MRSYRHFVVLCITSIAANAELSSRISFLSSPRQKLASVKTYDPNLFAMYKGCEGIVAALPGVPPLSQYDYHDKKHAVDVFFVRSMTTQLPYNNTLDTPASDASLFVIPVYWGQSFHKRCGDHKNNVKQLKEILMQSQQFRRSEGRDHVLICESQASCAHARENFPHMILGSAEVNPHISGPIIAVGDSTLDAIYACKQLPPVPIEERTLKVSFMGRTVKETDWRGRQCRRLSLLAASQHDVLACRDKYQRRRDLWCDYVSRADKPEGFKINAYQKSCKSSEEDAMLLSDRVDECVPYEDLRQSKIALSLSGDTPTTDRIFNAFSTLTPLAVLSNEKAELMSVLPTNVIPWDEILLEVSGEEFKRAPVRAVEELVERTNDHSLKAVQMLMQEYAPHVLWHVDGSKAPLHFLNAAFAKHHMMMSR